MQETSIVRVCSSDGGNAHAGFLSGGASDDKYHRGEEVDSSSTSEITTDSSLLVSYDSNSVHAAAVSLHEEKDLDDENSEGVMPVEVKLFYTTKNLSKHYSVIRHGGINVPPWRELRKESAALLKGVWLRVGDLVKVQCSTMDPMLVAEIAEIRDLQDGRHLLRVFWFKNRLSALRLLHMEDGRDINPHNFRWVKVAHTQVIMWDTVDRLLRDDERRKAMTDNVLCYLPKNQVQLVPKDSSTARWTRVWRY
ncbi:hypothetical protein B0J12DRAFT_705639 [Macrophomina phaseolina]|uniref:BAH domain-containing protein n=1 Tax=Macrophomina phaseolina TaxID=35725 RepID=A0ABQ8FU65_9PEZI|nr:hypothetical protein B0J12DRAFT_705639 [Macrophomina phaseolina]